MPEISRFFGIVIQMHFDDHAPPHFHALYGGQEVMVAIDPPRLLQGSLHPRAIGLVMEWTTLHHGELLADWRRAKDLQPLVSIEPLG